LINSKNSVLAYRSGFFGSERTAYFTKYYRRFFARESVRVVRRYAKKGYNSSRNYLDRAKNYRKITFCHDPGGALVEVVSSTYYITVRDLEVRDF